MAINVVGSKDCKICKVYCKRLEKEGLDYNYVVLQDLDIDRQNVIINKAKAFGTLEFPFVFRGEEMIEKESLFN